MSCSDGISSRIRTLPRPYRAEHQSGWSGLRPPTAVAVPGSHPPPSPSRPVRNALAGAGARESFCQGLPQAEFPSSPTPALSSPSPITFELSRKPWLAKPPYLLLDASALPATGNDEHAHAVLHGSAAPGHRNGVQEVGTAYHDAHSASNMR
ncbi:hypothetical protein CF328_g3284 [Tilletia controversa]|nr:hypothetical protein CF328_g3284 [Tilletia controversa]